MARPTGLEPVTYGLAYPLRLSPPTSALALVRELRPESNRR